MADDEIPEELLKTINEAFDLQSGSDKEKRKEKLDEVLKAKFSEKLGEHERAEVVKTLTQHDQEITREAFKAAVVRGLKLTRLNVVFRSYDLDNDGLITRHEIKRGMRRYNQTITDEEAEQIIIDMGDENRDGKIDFEEFSKKYL